MRVGDRWLRTIWADDDGQSVAYLDQTRLPSELVVGRLGSVDDAVTAIATMKVRGAPLIGVTAAYGLALAMRLDPTDQALARARERLVAARPTAVNLRWAVERVGASLAALPSSARAAEGFRLAGELAEADVAACRLIGEHGEAVLRSQWDAMSRSRPINVLTHCNAGWLATVDWGTATAPIYRAHGAGIPIHVWVDETRPRNQGLLTAWELTQEGVPHTVVVDNAGGLLMRRGMVDLCLVGTDRVAGNGDVANKIGTYLKALAAADNGIPFYVAAPTSSIDRSLADGSLIPIEERPPGELGHDRAVPVANPAFDVTPARLVTGLITERGLVPASADGINGLFSERTP